VKPVPLEKTKSGSGLMRMRAGRCSINRDH
jgi:hypothetical protein